MKLFENEFVGPSDLEINTLPSSSAIYVITLKDQDDFQPLYIGIASNLKSRIRNNLFHGLFSENVDNVNDVSIYYWGFNGDNREEAEELELKLVKQYRPEFNKASIELTQNTKLNEKIEKLKKEEETRSKQWFRSSIVASMTLIITISAIFTFYIEGKNKSGLLSILEKEVFIKSASFSKSQKQAESELKSLIIFLSEQREALTSLDLNRPEDFDKEIPKEIIKLNARIASIEAGVAKISESRILEKIKVIETSINGSPEKVLSVPLLRNDLKNYKLISDKELLRLEKSIEKIDSRLSFFVTTTITLTLGIFTAAIAPLIISFVQRKSDRKLNASNT